MYSGRLKTAQSIATIEVSDSSTVSDVVGAALDQFGLDPQTKLAYRMLKVVVEKGNETLHLRVLLVIVVCSVHVLTLFPIILGTVTERVLEADEKPWLLLKEHARDSLRQMEQIRFHMQRYKHYMSRPTQNNPNTNTFYLRRDGHS